MHALLGVYNANYGRFHHCKDNPIYYSLDYTNLKKWIPSVTMALMTVLYSTIKYASNCIHSSSGKMHGMTFVGLEPIFYIFFVCYLVIVVFFWRTSLVPIRIIAILFVIASSLLARRQINWFTVWPPTHKLICFCPLGTVRW